MLRTKVILSITVCLFTSPVVGQESLLLDSPEVRAAADAIRARNTVIVSREINSTKTICETRYCRCGLFGRRICAVRVRRNVIEKGTVQEQVDNLDDGIGWSNIGDPHLGFYESRYSLRTLPAAAGARGTKINLAAEVVLKDGGGVDFEFRDLDRVLVRTPRRLPGTVGARELIRVEALVTGRDDAAVINVKVQKRDAAGSLVEDSRGLNERAQAIWKSIQAELDK